MANVKRCTFCKGNGHTQFYCRTKPAQQLRNESLKTRAKRSATSLEWFLLNPPDAYGEWACYLKISPRCFKKVDKGNINLEHVQGKARHPGRKYDVTNLKAACPPCNELKGSKDLGEVL